MEPTATKFQPPHKGIFREETALIRHLFGYCVDHKSPVGGKIMKLPFITSTPYLTSSIRRFRLLGIDFDWIGESEHVIEHFNVGISYLDTECLQKWLVAPNCPAITGANDPIVSRYFAVGGPKCRPPRGRPFLLGEPESLSLYDFKKELDGIASASDHVLLFHGGKRELSVLQRLNIRLNSVCIIDTVKAAQYPLQLYYRNSLQDLLDKLEIPFAHLHNPGNDAFFVLRVFLMLAVIDAERESDPLLQWISVIKKIAQAQWPLMKDGKRIRTKRKASKWQPRQTIGNDETDPDRLAGQ